MTLRPEHSRLLSGLPAPQSTKLFTNTKLVRLKTGQILFRAGTCDDGCYRVEDGYRLPLWQDFGQTRP
jgi:CRP-like cAMP-binding protein